MERQVADEAVTSCHWMMEINYFMVTSHREGEVRTDPIEDLKGMLSVLYLTSCLWFDEAAFKFLCSTCACVLVWIMRLRPQLHFGSVTGQWLSKHKKMMEVRYLWNFVSIKANSSLFCLSALFCLLACKLYNREFCTCNMSPQTHSFTRSSMTIAFY